MTIAGVVLYRNYPSNPGNEKKQYTEYASDAELISHANEEEFRSIIEQVRQAESDRQALLAQLYKDNTPIGEEKKKVENDPQLTPEQRTAELRRLGDQLIKNYTNFKNAVIPRQQKLLSKLRPFGSLHYTEMNHYSYLKDNNIEITQKHNFYEEPNFFRVGTYTVYSTEKGYIVFGENSRPDPRAVVDNIDKFHASGNIKTTVQSVLWQFGAEKGAEQKRYLYVHIEGNLYLYFYVLQGVRTPNDEDNY